MHLPKELTTVTRTSKTVALVMFVTMPIIGFLFGMRYQQMQDTLDRILEEQTLTINRTPTLVPWKKYSDSKYFFSFSYPSDWNITVNKDPKPPGVAEESIDIKSQNFNDHFDGNNLVNGKNSQAKGGMVQLFISKNTTALDYTCHFTGLTDLQACNKIAINGIPAVEAIFNPYESQSVVQLQNGNERFVFSLLNAPLEKQTNTTLITILNSFQFGQ